MVKVNEVNIRVNSAMKPAIGIQFSSGVTCSLMIEHDQTIEEVLKSIDIFRDTIVRTDDEAKQREHNRELFSELLNLSSGKDLYGNLVLNNNRMVEIAKLIPDTFHHLPDDIRVGTTIQLRGVG